MLFFYILTFQPFFELPNDLISSEPPLNEEDVPLGEWLCPRCRALHHIRDIIDKRKKSAHGTSQNSKKLGQTIDKGKPSKTLDPNEICNNHKLVDQKLNNNTNNHHNPQILDTTTDDSHKIRLLNRLSARKNPFADLVRISLLLNPREYELPEDYVPNIQFPGTSKKLIANTGNREARHTSYSVKRAQELERNNLPLILRTCYFCRKGCRKAPLIHCDYCPLVYHPDCIDPPLTILPNTRWMCPNHVEPIAEEKLLSSTSFCERVKLWNHFSKPIDQESIKISFLDKVHRSTSPILVGVDGCTKLGSRVPKRIKREYDRFIVNVERYEGESDNDDDDDSDGNEKVEPDGSDDKKDEHGDDDNNNEQVTSNELNNSTN